MAEAAKDLWKGLSEGFLGVLNRIIRLWNDFELKLNVPFGPDITIGTPNLPEIQGLKYGGNIIREGIALVGEAGPEIVHLPAGARVSPLLAGDTGIAQDVIVTSPIEISIDGKVVARQIDRRVGSARARA